MKRKLHEIEQIYHALLGKDNAQERMTYLDEVCAGDADLRADVEALVKANELAGDFLERAPGDCRITLESPMEEGPGTIIGPYKLLEKIGEGGMAVVYMAQQTHPLKRRIALKIIKLGMDTKEVIARFEVERQALAMMDHPNIAKVIDAGATDSGRPYFVMELVRGVSITDYCDTNKLSTRERLELFVPVCNAVHHAHQKGIIHRDLKPSNIMVTMHDGKPVPMVIDFGIAKATNQRLTEKTVFTRYAQMIGTPEYMSPEQAEMSGLDIDTRTDIYSLGIVLYELLSGVLPFDSDTMRAAALAEIQRIIREEEPPRPSTRLSMLGERATRIAASRRTDVHSLARRLHSELEWIPLMALRKDRTRRYQSTLELGADVQNYLKGAPLLAGPESRVYRCKKFVRRYRASITALVGMAAVMIAMVVSLCMYVRSQRALYALEELKCEQLLSRAERLSAEGRDEVALAELESALKQRDLGPKAQLLNARILIQVGRQADAQNVLATLTSEGPEIAGPAHYLLAQISLGTDPSEAEEHKRQAEKMLPNTAEAYSLCAVTALTPNEALDWLDKALEMDPLHYPSRKARALIFCAQEAYQMMAADAAVMTALRPMDSLGYALQAIYWHQLKQWERALQSCNQAIQHCTIASDLPDLYDQRRAAYMQMGLYEQALQDAQLCVSLRPGELTYLYNVFFAHVLMKDYSRAYQAYSTIVRTKNPSYYRFWHSRFYDWSQKQVLNWLCSGQTIDLPTQLIHRIPFSGMAQVVRTYHELIPTTRRLSSPGLFAKDWSPDSTKLLVQGQHIFGEAPWPQESLEQALPNLPGNKELAIIDIKSGEKSLVADSAAWARWSPDGKNIAYSGGYAEGSKSEVWIVDINTKESRRVAMGTWPIWSEDSKRLYYLSGYRKGDIYSINIEDPTASPERIVSCPGYFVLPDQHTLVYETHAEICMAEFPSGRIIHKWRMPWPLWGWGLNLSADRKVVFAHERDNYGKAGIWTLDLEDKSARHIFDRPVYSAHPAPNGEMTALTVTDALFIAPHETDASIHIALGNPESIEEFLMRRLQERTLGIEAGPNDPEAYFERARVYLALQEYDKAKADLRIFKKLMTAQDGHLYQRMCRWVWNYQRANLYEGGEILGLLAAELLPQFPDVQLGLYGQMHPTKNLVLLYEKWGKPERAEEWRARQSLDAKSMQ